MYKKWTSWAGPSLKAIFLRLYPVPRAHEEMFKKEVEKLFLIGVLDEVNYSELVAPSFAQPEPKSNRACFLCDSRNINKQLKKNYELCQI